MHRFVRYAFLTAAQCGRDLGSITADLAHSCRAITRHWRFTTLIAITLALVIGAGTTVFSVVNAVLLQPLPYADSERLVWLWSVRSENPLKQRASYPDFVDWRAASRTLDLVGYGGIETVLTGAGEPERLHAELFVGDLFALLGVAPMLGPVSPEATRDEPAVILGHALWRRSPSSTTLRRSRESKGEPHALPPGSPSPR